MIALHPHVNVTNTETGKDKNISYKNREVTGDSGRKDREKDT